MTTASNTADRTAVPQWKEGEEEPTHDRAQARTREGIVAETADDAPEDVTESHRRRVNWRRLFLPPEPWQNRPASLAAMWRYARLGGWTGPGGPARLLGKGYFLAVALPVTVLCHYTAWIIARPARAVVIAGLWTMAMQVPELYTVADLVLPWSPLLGLPGGVS